LAWLFNDSSAREEIVDIGPTADGRIPVIMQERRPQIGGSL
jgi:hypothetical protein